MTRMEMLKALAVSVAALGAAAACQPKVEAPEPAGPVEINPFLGETVLGDPAAPVEIIEYASTTCGHCEAFHRIVLPELKTRYIETGKAKLVYRVLPTTPGALSAAGAAIARCAGEDQFFAVIDDLFASQEKIMRAARSEESARAALVDVGERHGLSAAQTQACISDPRIAEQLETSLSQMPDFVQATPTLIVNGFHIEEPSPENMIAAIDAALAPPGTLPAPAN